MKRILQGKETVFLGRRADRLLGCAAVEPPQLHRAVNRFGATVSEEHAVEAGPFHQLAGKRALKCVVIEVGKMNGAHGLAANHFDNARMRVAEGIDGDAAKKIEIFFARRVKNVGPAAMGHDHGLPLVGGQEKLFGIRQTHVRSGSRRRQFLGFLCRRNFRAFLG